MSNLAEFAKHVEDYAKSIDKSQGVVKELSSLGSLIDVLVDDLGKAKDSIPLLIQSFNSAQGSVKDLQGLAASLSERSKGVDKALAEQSEKIIADARARGQAEVTGIRKEHESTIARLKDAIVKAEGDLKNIQSQVHGARAEHDQVLASMESLQKRLAGK